MTQRDFVQAPDELDRMLTGFYDRLSNQMAGGKRVHPEELLPEAQDPLEGLVPEDQVDELGFSEWMDPAFWAITSPERLTDQDLVNIPDAGGEVRSGKGSDFFRSGEAPNNYANRHNPLYKARTEFIRAINPQIEKMFGVRGGGVGYYRPPKASDAAPGGRSSNSDHYSAGAVDYYGTPEQLDAVAAWARSQPFVSFVRWRSESHYDHVHMSIDIGWIAKNFYKGREVPPLQSPTRVSSTPSPTLPEGHQAAPIPSESSPATPPPITPGRPS